VPNSILTAGAVRNHSALPQRRVQWTLPVAATDDLAAVEEALRQRVVAAAHVLAEPPPQVFVQDWQTDKRILIVTAWTANENAVSLQQELLEELGKCVEEVRAKQAATERADNA